jgi:hypothetical protein
MSHRKKNDNLKADDRQQASFERIDETPVRQPGAKPEHQHRQAAGQRKRSFQQGSPTHRRARYGEDRERASASAPRPAQAAITSESESGRATSAQKAPLNSREASAPEKTARYGTKNTETKKKVAARRSPDPSPLRGATTGAALAVPPRARERATKTKIQGVSVSATSQAAQAAAPAKSNAPPRMRA